MWPAGEPRLDLGGFVGDIVIHDDMDIEPLGATHIRRRIMVWEKPVSAAIERIDQCVASTGVVRNVRSITAAT
jgi:hypothetical protein